MAATSNQEIERYYFELFRRIFPLPNGQVKYGDKPDVIIEGESALGIEVTNFYLQKGNVSESLQKQRQIRKVVLKKAQQQYFNEGGKYEISFSFNEDFPIRDVQKLISKIVEVIRKLEDFKTGGIRILNYFSDIPEVDFVYINPNLYSNPQWRNVQVYSGINQMSITKLEQILVEKEKKSKKYTKCDTYWLLIILDSFDRAQEQLMPEEVLNGEVKLVSDVYEKIILFLNQEQRILHLKG